MAKEKAPPLPPLIIPACAHCLQQKTFMGKLDGQSTCLQCWRNITGEEPPNFKHFTEDENMYK
jgi:hypothetical protein